ncbi:PAS domain S-box [Synechococcus sp. PCC 7502]|uniref:PAS domain S-box protein n=1 Tax=Synechococcus sp. PCC 7502 TaxID=1173263 RepID=UPI00029FFBE6|nr:PAS domain S-box protein [Synechococcus sp. PCC 7502]AFY73802.1 PAS domain S-box [Synechococcus sp. PCC 7502]
MAKLEYKILVAKSHSSAHKGQVRDQSCDYENWLRSDRQVSYHLQELVLTPSQLDLNSIEQIEQIKQFQNTDCILWDRELDDGYLKKLENLNVAIVILVDPAANLDQITELNYLSKATLSQELLSSTIRHQITETRLSQKLLKAEAALAEQELLKQKLQLEQSVNLLLQSIYSTFDLSSIFTAATTGLGKLLKLDRVEVIKYLPDLETWTSLVQYQEIKDLISKDQEVERLDRVMPEQNYLIAEKLKQGEIIAVNSCSELDSTVSQAVLREYPESWLIVPLVVGSELWGAVSMESQIKNRHWLGIEVDLAINISTQLAIAIQQSNFYTELQQELERYQTVETQRKQAEAALLASENRYYQVIQAQKDFILRSLSDTTITFANDSLCHVLGITTEQIIGRKWADFAIAEDLPKLMTQLSNLSPANPSFLIEKQDYLPNQKVRWTQWINQGIFNDAGQLIEIQSVGRDITALKQAEAELKQLNQELETRIEKRTTDLRRSKEILQISEQRFRSFFTLAPIGITVADASTFQIVAVNQAYCRFLGYTEDELLKIESLNSITESADWALEKPLADSMIKGGINAYQLEQRFIKKSGQVVIGEITATKISDLDGNVTHILKMVQDITDRKRDKEALKRSKELLRLTIENTPIGILTLSLEGKFLTVNQDACRIFGYSSDQLLQMTTRDITHPDYLESTINVLEQVVRGEVLNVQLENQYIHNTGRIIDAISRIGIVRDEDGRPLHFVAGVEDITEKKRTERILRQQFERQNFITKITQQIRQSLDLEEVLTAAVNEVSSLLNCDRIIIFQLFPNGASQVVKEIVKPPYPSIIGMNWQDEHFSHEGFEYYINSNPRTVNDVFEDNVFADCLKEFMSQAQIKSKIVAPIIQHIQSCSLEPYNRWRRDNSQLWGLLIVHSCGEYRQWDQEEADLLQQVANQLAIAIQQADLYQQVQQELQSKEKLYLRLANELSQKEILLKEIHHRVKNNLQVMSSLLRMQFRKTTPEVKALCEEYQNRIQSMALIHDQLHRSNDLANIDFHTYITNLTTNLFQCYGTNTNVVQLKLAVKDIFLPLDQSIPLGLIINELVSNALKYAFPEGYGEININLTTSNNSLHLCIADDGVGIPEDFDFETSDSLGMQLVYSLTDQLEGEVQCDRTSGTKFEITFPIV